MKISEEMNTLDLIAVTIVHRICGNSFLLLERTQIHDVFFSFNDYEHDILANGNTWSIQTIGRSCQLVLVLYPVGSEICKRLSKFHRFSLNRTGNKQVDGKRLAHPTLINAKRWGSRVGLGDDRRGAQWFEWIDERSPAKWSV